MRRLLLVCLVDDVFTAPLNPKPALSFLLFLAFASFAMEYRDRKPRLLLKAKQL